MNEEELDFSFFPSFCDIPGCKDSFSNEDELLEEKHACTHTHICNPNGPDNLHTHTCYHVHSKILAAATSEDKVPTDEVAKATEKKAKKRPLGNKEAVRRYRENKKAKAALMEEELAKSKALNQQLEDELVKSKALNQQLTKKLQKMACLEVENADYKYLLMDIRGRIEVRIGPFLHQKPTNNSGDVCQNSVSSNLPGAYLMNPCNIQWDDQLCSHPEPEGENDVDFRDW